MLDRALAWVAAKGVPISASWVEIDVWDGFESQP
jgi:hypothetical protein